MVVVLSGRSGLLLVGHVAADVAGQGHADRELVAAGHGPAQLRPPVDVPGQGRGQVIDFPRCEPPMIRDVVVADRDVERAAEGCEQAAHDRLVDLRGLLLEEDLVETGEVVVELGSDRDLGFVRGADRQVSAGHVAPSPGTGTGHHAGPSAWPAPSSAG